MKRNTFVNFKDFIDNNVILMPEFDKKKSRAYSYKITNNIMNKNIPNIIETHCNSPMENNKLCDKDGLLNYDGLCVGHFKEFNPLYCCITYSDTKNKLCKNKAQPKYNGICKKHSTILAEKRKCHGRNNTCNNKGYLVKFHGYCYVCFVKEIIDRNLNISDEESKVDIVPKESKYVKNNELYISTVPIIFVKKSNKLYLVDHKYEYLLLKNISPMVNKIMFLPCIISTNHLNYLNNIDIDSIGDTNIKRRNIPQSVKVLVFEKRNGKKRYGKCSTCSREIDIMNFHCGHIIPDSIGGPVHINNLEPICAKCNLGMGDENLNEFTDQWFSDIHSDICCNIL